jgi:hypothetical protein
MTATNATATIVNEFIEQIDTEKEYELNELKQMLTDIYKAKTAPNKEAKQPKKSKKNLQSTNNENKSEETDESDNDKPKKRGRPVKGPKLDKNGNEKAKREPSAYNKYVKERISALKIETPETSAKELMLTAASEWKQLSKEDQEKYK